MNKQNNEQETLLELVNECPVTVVKTTDNNCDAKLERVKELRSLGFNQLADELEKSLTDAKLKKVADYKYIRISDDMVIAFLKRKVERYNREHEEKKEKKKSDSDDWIDWLRYSRNLLAQQMSRQIDESIMSSGRRLAEDIRLRQQMPMTQAPRREIELPTAIQNVLYAQYRQHDYEIMHPIIVECEEVDYSTELQFRLIGLDRRNGLRIVLPIIDGVRELILPHIRRRSQMVTPAEHELVEMRRRWEEANLIPFNEIDISMMNGAQIPKFTQKTCDFYSTEQGKTGQYVWEEHKLADYKGIPPKEVLETLKEHKERGVFDYFTIASVKGIRDPLLLGRINNHKDRFFVTQWGVDVTLDDLL